MLPYNVRQTYQHGKRKGVATIKVSRTRSIFMTHRQLEIYGVTSTNKIPY